ncbi:PREDICTED: uncharacterized protein LOC106815133 [Priapulus caudatus]|uniref:Uncharacterized protein LOC106815133 n=1 Tax=Priapulus caudatus TaxID=37621 RepID=A0ABM1ES80_PRICU|nr:PREDICTED: uncharacterized protein LOC106815133 [Priapulus caudatus]
MSVIIRLQNLPWEAKAIDIRNFFHGLSIPDGGVHIIGGENGDAFIAFTTDEDARQAMDRDRTKLKNGRVKLKLSSKNEMQNIIDLARGSLGMVDTRKGDTEQPEKSPASEDDPQSNISAQQALQQQQLYQQHALLAGNNQQLMFQQRGIVGDTVQQQVGMGRGVLQAGMQQQPPVVGGGASDLNSPLTNLMGQISVQNLQNILQSAQLSGPHPGTNSQLSSMAGASSQLPNLPGANSHMMSLPMANAQLPQFGVTSQQPQIMSTQATYGSHSQSIMAFPTMQEGTHVSSFTNHSLVSSGFSNQNDVTQDLFQPMVPVQGQPGYTRFSDQVHPQGLKREVEDIRSQGDGKRQRLSEFTIEMSNIPPSSSYRDIRQFFKHLFIARDGIKMVNDQRGYIGISLVKFDNERSLSAAFRMNGECIRGAPVNIRSVPPEVFHIACDPTYGQSPGGWKANLEQQSNSAEMPTSAINRNLDVPMSRQQQFGQRAQREADNPQAYFDDAIQDRPGPGHRIIDRPGLSSNRGGLSMGQPIQQKQLAPDNFTQLQVDRVAELGPDNRGLGPMDQQALSGLVHQQGPPRGYSETQVSERGFNGMTRVGPQPGIANVPVDDRFPMSRERVPMNQLGQRGMPVNQRDPIPNPRGPIFDRRGAPVDNRGPLLNERGNFPEHRGPAFNRPGSHPGGQRFAPRTMPPLLDENDMINQIDQRENSLGQRMEMQRGPLMDRDGRLQHRVPNVNQVGLLTDRGRPADQSGAVERRGPFADHIDLSKPRASSRQRDVQDREESLGRRDERSADRREAGSSDKRQPPLDSHSSNNQLQIETSKDSDRRRGDQDRRDTRSGSRRDTERKDSRHSRRDTREKRGSSRDRRGRSKDRVRDRRDRSSERGRSKRSSRESSHSRSTRKSPVRDLDVVKSDGAALPSSADKKDDDKAKGKDDKDDEKAKSMPAEKEGENRNLSNMPAQKNEARKSDVNEKPQLSTSKAYKIVLRNMPIQVGKKEVVRFFDKLHLNDDNITLQASTHSAAGTGYIKLKSRGDVETALAYNRMKLGHRYVDVQEDVRGNDAQPLDAEKPNSSQMPTEEKQNKNTDNNETHDRFHSESRTRVSSSSNNFIKMSNLPYRCNNEMVASFLHGIEIVKNGILISSEGNCYIEPATKEDYERALDRNGRQLRNRPIELKPANLDDVHAVKEADKRREERRKAAANRQDSGERRDSAPSNRVAPVMKNSNVLDESSKGRNDRNRGPDTDTRAAQESRGGILKGDKPVRSGLLGNAPEDVAGGLVPQRRIGSQMNVHPGPVHGMANQLQFPGINAPQSLARNFSPGQQRFMDDGRDGRGMPARPGLLDEDMHHGMENNPRSYRVDGRLGMYGGPGRIMDIDHRPNETGGSSIRPLGNERREGHGRPLLGLRPGMDHQDMDYDRRGPSDNQMDIQRRDNRGRGSERDRSLLDRRDDYGPLHDDRPGGRLRDMPLLRGNDERASAGPMDMPLLRGNDERLANRPMDMPLLRGNDNRHAGRPMDMPLLRGGDDRPCGGPMDMPMLRGGNDRPGYGLHMDMPYGRGQFTTVKISNISHDIPINDILAFFQNHNVVPDSVRLGLNERGKPNGEGLIDFFTREGALKAVRELHQRPLAKRPVSLFLM